MPDTVSKEGRRPFKRQEITWVSRQLRIPRANALRLMDALYRKYQVADLLDDMTWCVVRKLAPGGPRVILAERLIFVGGQADDFNMYGKEDGREIVHVCKCYRGPLGRAAA